jgi:hypothetical protein
MMVTVTVMVMMVHGLGESNFAHNVRTRSARVCKSHITVFRDFWNGRGP